MSEKGFSVDMSTTAVVDPRMPEHDEPPPLADRPGDLNAGTVLLWDNGKLHDAYGPYRAILDAVSEEIRGSYPMARVEQHRENLLVGGVDWLQTRAADVAAQGIAAVVIALCDWGVSQPSTIFATELERRGVATCIIATEVGSRQVLASAAFMLPGLPIVKLEASRDVPYEAAFAEMRQLAPDVVRGLTASRNELLRLADQRPTIATANSDGVIEVSSDDPSLAFTAKMAGSGLGDGFPLVAPTPERVSRVLDEMRVAADAAVWPPIVPRSTCVTAADVAVVAVMAGIEARWAPVVLAAYRAMGEPEFRLFQAAITTHPGGTLVLVSGPLSDELGIAGGSGCLGPGFRANATIGRAVALGPSFLLGARPGMSDLTVQGSPAEYSYCCAENLTASPWPGLHVDFGYSESTTTVTVVKCEGPHNMLDQQSTEPARMLDTFSDTIATLGGNNAYMPECQTVIFLTPEHAAILHAAGWTKQDVQTYLYDAARNSREELRGRGVTPIWPESFDALDDVPVVLRPEDFLLAVVGSAGPASQVAIPWGHSRAVTRAIDASAGVET